jgi:adenylate cyclase
VVGYSRLMAEDEEETVRRLGAYRTEITNLVGEHRGRIVDFTGDNFLAEFPTATDAVEAAAEIQRVLKARNAAVPAGRAMEFRIGVHLGEVRVEGERIYGDGVNIAARLEELAESGGICISGAVHEQVRHKLELGYADAGEQELKNIPDPVHAYRISPSHDTARLPLPGRDELTVPGFGGAPAVAVLPFDNLSGDPDQEYFVDGIVEDLITRLSSWGTLPVIARNSSFVYRGRSVDVKQVSRELGVRYVVEGSVRRAGERIRISAQLIDAVTGAHVWADTYDRDLQDVFAVQDEITQTLVASINPELARAEMERAAHKEPRSLDAYELTTRAIWHAFRFTKEDNRIAQSLCEQAIELDALSASAFAVLSQVHFADIVLRWTDAPDRARDEQLRTAQNAVSLDPRSAVAQLALGIAHRITGQKQQARAAFERAIQLNPSLGSAYGELAFLSFDRPEEAMALLEKQLRLSPLDPMADTALARVAFLHLGAGRYEQAIDWALRSLRRRPKSPIGNSILAASYAHVGRLEEASRAVRELWPENDDQGPSLAGLEVFLAETERTYRGVLGSALIERLSDGLRKAVAALEE